MFILFFYSDFMTGCHFVSVIQRPAQNNEYFPRLYYISFC